MAVPGCMCIGVRDLTESIFFYKKAFLKNNLNILCTLEDLEDNKAEQQRSRLKLCCFLPFCSKRGQRAH